MTEIVNRVVYDRTVEDGYISYGNDVELLTLWAFVGFVEFQIETLVGLLDDEEMGMVTGADVSWSVDMPPQRARLIADVIDQFLRIHATAHNPDDIEEIDIEAGENVNFEISPTSDKATRENVAIRFYPKGGATLYWYHHFKAKVLLMFARDLRDFADEAEELAEE